MFMRPVVTFDTWITYEDSQGDTYQCPASDFTPDMGEETERVEGWSGRMSAAGYLDCTEWCGVFDAPIGAYRALADSYADDSGDESPDDAAVWESLRAECEAQS